MKILLLDLETSPLEAYSWGPKWETNLIEVTAQSQILSYSAKWFGGKSVTRGQIDTKGYKPGVVNDEILVRELWSLLDGADSVVAQNGKDFDVRVMNARFVFYGLTPPSPYTVIDPKVEAKKYLRLPSNSLNDICDYYGIGRKVEHEGFNLWTKCIAGDKKAWKRMKRYNKHDVTLMEKLYILLRPWMKTHPNAGLFTEGAVCPKCGSSRLQSRGSSVTSVAVYKRYQCQSCAGWSRGKVKTGGVQLTNT
jgi:hypothetical protein